MSAWVKCSERRPAFGVMVRVMNSRVITEGNFRQFYWRNKDGNTMTVTHWQPLPDPPEAE